jgi:hypothetical protein
MSDILPDDVGFYAGEEEEEGEGEGEEGEGEGESLDTRQCSIPLTHTAREVVLEQGNGTRQVRDAEQVELVSIEVDQQAGELDLGSEVQSSLPVIREGEYPYYPLPSYFPRRRVERDVEGLVRGRERKLVKKNGSVGGGSRVRKFLRKLFQRRGKGMA